MDNAGIHVAKSTKKFLDERQVIQRMNVAYRPEYNSIEFVWNLAKQKYRKEIAQLKAKQLPINNR